LSKGGNTAVRTLDEDVASGEIRNTALGLLTGREFSRFELEAKLRKRYHENDVIKVVLDKLVKDGLQCDYRYTGAFVRSRVVRGHGPARIRLDIAQKGIKGALLERVFQEERVDWFALANDVAKKKFGNKRAEDNREISRRMRFLQYRGFDFDQIKYALSSSTDQ
jgi:regulatory protein